MDELIFIANHFVTAAPDVFSQTVLKYTLADAFTKINNNNTNNITYIQPAAFSENHTVNFNFQSSIYIVVYRKKHYRVCTTANKPLCLLLC